MKGIFGIVSLLIALAIVGLVAARQLKSVGLGSATPGASAPAGASRGNEGTVREQSQRLQDKVRSDVVKALEQGARRDEPAQ